jgi:hypothetical protein
MIVFAIKALVFTVSFFRAHPVVHKIETQRRCHKTKPFGDGCEDKARAPWQHRI